MELEELEEYLIQQAVIKRKLMLEQREYCKRAGIKEETHEGFLLSRARWVTIMDILHWTGLYKHYLDVVTSPEFGKGGGYPSVDQIYNMVKDARSGYAKRRIN